MLFGDKLLILERQTISVALEKPHNEAEYIEHLLLQRNVPVNTCKGSAEMLTSSFVNNSTNGLA